MILVDANVILDVWNPDPTWHTWSLNQLRTLSAQHELAINPIIFAEISVSFSTLAAVEQRVDDLGILVLSIPKSAAFQAGKAHLQYRRQGGVKTNVLPDFFIGAHASALGCPLLTRDTKRYAAYFSNVRMIHP